MPKEVQRGLRRENESAETLAKAGYRVRHLNESAQLGVQNPDYEIEGRIFDNFAPTSDNVEQVRKGISDKVSREQATRIVLNLDDTSVVPEKVSGILQRKPKEGLQEIIVIKGREIHTIFP